MRRYDFKCDEHGIFEVEQSLEDFRRIVNCPTCGSECHIIIPSSFIKWGIGFGRNNSFTRTPESRKEAAKMYGSLD